MTDTAGMGTAVGASIVGSRPIIVLRFKFFMVKLKPISYACCQSKRNFWLRCTSFVRAIASEANYGQGPLHGNNYHSPFIHMPGLKVCAPMIKEYLKIWNEYKRDNSPYLVSEHRSSYKSDKELKIYTTKTLKLLFLQFHQQDTMHKDYKIFI